MKRIVMAAVGSLGDLHPYIAIGKELLSRGHRPVIATTDRYRSLVEAEGIEYASLRPPEAQFGGLEAIAAKVFDPYRGPRYLIREMVMPYVREQYEDISSACKAADLLVTHPLTVAGPLVSAKTGLPWVSSVLAPASLLSAIDRPLLHSAIWARVLQRSGVAPYGLFMRAVRTMTRGWERPLDELRAELGLPRVREGALFGSQFSPRLNLALFARLIAEPQRDWPPNTLLTGFPRFDAVADAKALGEFDSFVSSGPPPLVFALGSSVVMIAGAFWEKAAQASLRLGQRAVFLTGTPLAAALPDSIKAFDYLPYSAAFPKAAAVIHPAGIGTLAQAILAGRPQLIVPAAFDQPDNARRAVKLGVARSLAIRKITAAGLARELAALLATPSFAHNARNAARGLDGGSQRAADALIAAIS